MFDDETLDLALAVERATTEALSPRGELNAGAVLARLRRLSDRMAAAGFWRSMVDEGGVDWPERVERISRTIRAAMDDGWATGRAWKKGVRVALKVALDDLRPLTGAARQRECV